MPQESIDEEIKWLESQLESKKRELAKKGIEQKEERETIKEILREATVEEKPKISLPSPAIFDDAAQKTAVDLQEKKHEEIIDSLVNLAFTKNLMFAVKVAKTMKNPHILDEFHDVLADHYYRKLLEARKIKE